MAGIKISYEEARSKMRAGDVIAFGGSNFMSALIKGFSFSQVSHVGVILQTKVLNDPQDRFLNQLIESTSDGDFFGVQINRMSERMAYDGEIWWLPLSEASRENFDQVAFYDFLLDKKGHAFDVKQALQSAFDTTDELPFGLHGPAYAEEDFAKFFCSELVAAGLARAGVTSCPVNSAEVTPIDLCRWKIFTGDYYQLKGDGKKSISRFNTLDPCDWNY